MAASLEKLEAQTLKLSIKERSELAHRLIASLDGNPEGTPEEIAKVWEEEIARRVAEIDAGQAQLILGEDAFAEIDAIIAEHEK